MKELSCACFMYLNKSEFMSYIQIIVYTKKVRLYHKSFYKSIEADESL